MTLGSVYEFRCFAKLLMYSFLDYSQISGFFLSFDFGDNGTIFAQRSTARKNVLFRGNRLLPLSNPMRLFFLVKTISSSQLTLTRRLQRTTVWFYEFLIWDSMHDYAITQMLFRWVMDYVFLGNTPSVIPDIICTIMSILG